MFWAAVCVLIIGSHVCKTQDSSKTKESGLPEFLLMSSKVGAKERKQEIIGNLHEYTTNKSSGLQPSQITEILSILDDTIKSAAQSKVSMDETTAKDALGIANEFLKADTWPAVAKDDQKLGPQILNTMEYLFLGMRDTEALTNISYANIDLKGVSGSCGQAGQGKYIEVGTGVRMALPAANEDSCTYRVFSVTYKTLEQNFPSQFEGQNESGKSYKIVSDIMTNSMILDDDEYHAANVNMTFNVGRRCGRKLTCAFWNSTSAKWSSSGCTTITTNGVTNCACNHLTSFALLMSSSTSTIDSLNDYIMALISTVGQIVSMASLVVCIILQVLLIRDAASITASFRSVALLNTSICLLLNNGCSLLTCYHTPDDNKDLCVALTFCNHFSQLAFLSWTLVQSLFLVCRLVFVFYHVTKTEFMITAMFIGYVCPIIISVATFLYFFPAGTYMKEKMCWLSYCSGAYMAAIVPSGVILVVNVLVLIVVILTLLRPPISDGTKEECEALRKMMKAVLICTPQFGLTWGIAIPIFIFGRSLILSYTFLILHSFQGWFLFIAGCLLDPKALHILKRLIYRRSSATNSSLVSKDKTRMTEEKTKQHTGF